LPYVFSSLLLPFSSLLSLLSPSLIRKIAGKNKTLKKLRGNPKALKNYGKKTTNKPAAGVCQGFLRNFFLFRLQAYPPFLLLVFPS
jgi:hypothetical protein